MMNLEFNSKKLSSFVILVLLMMVLPTVGANDCMYNIGDYVWNDIDRDGIQDAGEPGLENIEVTLYNCNDDWVGSTTTDSAGIYNFEVTAGDYYVEFTLPSGMVFSPANVGGDTTDSDTTDSDAGPDGMTECTTLDYCDEDLTLDAGMYCITPPGTGTPGYWMNHPEAWPVSGILIGNVYYPQEVAIAIMKAPVKGDKTLTMFPALVAAKLNVEIGNDPSCIADTIAAADAWMAANPVGSGKKGNSPAWEEGEPLYEQLDLYNNGELCAPSRDDLEDL